MAKRNPNLRAYVKFDKLGQVVPGSLILRYSPPESGRSFFWKEITNDECCIANESSYSLTVGTGAPTTTLLIFVNGNESVNTTTTSSGTFTANAGNFVDVEFGVDSAALIQLVVTDSDGTTLYSNSDFNTGDGFQFTAELGHTYTVTASSQTTTTTTTTTTSTTTTTTTSTTSTTTTTTTT